MRRSVCVLRTPQVMSVNKRRQSYGAAMRIRLRASFVRDIRRVRGQSLLNRVNQQIAEKEAASSLRSIFGIRRMSAPSGNRCRIRIGNHRIGVTMEGSVGVLAPSRHRSDTYRRFP